MVLASTRFEEEIVKKKKLDIARMTRHRTETEHLGYIHALDSAGKVLTALNLPWFLFGGTLLGAYRNGDLIPWDHDIDVAVAQENLLPTFKQMNTMLLEEGFVERHLYWRKKNRGATLSYKRFFADMGFENTQDPFVGVDIKVWQLDGEKRRRGRFRIPTALFNNHGSVMLREKPYPAPGDSEAMLRHIYGPTWKTPKKMTGRLTVHSKNYHPWAKQKETPKKT